MKPKVFGYLLLALVLLATSGSNAQQPPRVTGFFTDMHYIQETGEVLGDEVWIVYARGKFWATVQIAEGSPEPPVIVPVEVSGSTVKFALTQKQVGPDGKPVPDLVIPFEGTVTQLGLSGTANSGPFNLQRHASFWQQQTTTTELAGSWETMTSDSLGNLITVPEADPARRGTLTTAYTYDWMNHVSQVTMARGSTTQTRTFNYNV